MTPRWIILFLLQLISFYSRSQTWTQHSENVFKYRFFSKGVDSLQLNGEYEFVVIHSKLYHNDLSINNIPTSVNTHYDGSGIAYNLVDLENRTTQLEIKTSQPDSILIYLISPPHSSTSPLNPIRTTGLPCDEPDGITQEIWRNEPTVLPSPKVIPVETQVSHVIIHHSAGSNTNTNYQDVVRAIYTHHTQVNGWDDVGYNYLIAQDGTLFLGRDPQGAMDQDNARGAHMCNKNNYTMAVCLLGNFETTAPTQAALTTLEQLTAWKLNKENLFPHDSYLHSIGPSSANLPPDQLSTIAGHREGCEQGYTVCPGKNLFGLMDSIKSKVEEIIEQDCAAAGMSFNEQPKVHFTPNPAVTNLEILHAEDFQKIEIYNLQGILQAEYYNEHIELIDLNSGSYLCKIHMGNIIKTRKLVISK